ncbi:MAG: hypothetical protein B7Z66_09790 [Chromatiales bacterium 21-64-14]|nr:MAG: hypothetical protein B7Z66_09790 [Chromatiales bacterium 21-64-14]
MRKNLAVWVYLAMVGGMVIFLMGTWVESFAPPPDHFSTVSGWISDVQRGYGKNAREVEFFVSGTVGGFWYPSFFPNDRVALHALRRGAFVSVRYSGTAKRPQLWALTVNGYQLLTVQGTYKARRRNGDWGLAGALVFGSLLALFAWRIRVVSQRRKTAQDSLP